MKTLPTILSQILPDTTSKSSKGIFDVHVIPQAPKAHVSIRIANFSTLGKAIAIYLARSHYCFGKGRIKILEHAMLVHQERHSICLQRPKETDDRPYER